MYCRQCDYPLLHLDRWTCPECGHPFDAEQPDTYVRNQRRYRRGLDRFGKGSAVLLLLLGVYGFAYAGLVRTGYHVNNQRAAAPTSTNSFFVQSTLATSVPVYGGVTSESVPGKVLQVAFSPAHLIDRNINPNDWQDIKTGSS